MRKILTTLTFVVGASACATAPVDLDTAAVSRGDLTIERLGGRVPGVAMGVTRIDRTLWIGTRAVIDTSRPDEPMRGELVRVDLDSGESRVFEDELPRVDEYPGEQPVWTAGAVSLGRRTYLASYQGLVIVDGDRIELRAIEVGDRRVAARANVIALDARHGHERLWLGTDVGLVAVDPVSGAVVDHLAPDVLGGEHVVSLSMDAQTGGLFAVVHGEDGSTRAVHVRAGRVVSRWAPSDGGHVRSVEAAGRLGGVLVAVSSFEPSTGGVFLWHGGEGARRLASEGELALAARGRVAPFGTAVMTYDAEGGMLVVGGQLRPGGVTGAIVGGGLVWIDLNDTTPRMAGISTETSALRGDHVTALAWDPVRRRTYAAVHGPCDEFKLANLGVETIRFEGGAPRFERTVLSGVRDISVDRDGVTLALRDGPAGNVCAGVAINEGVVQLHGDGRGTIPDHRDRAVPSFHLNRSTAAFLSREGGLLAVASSDLGLFVGGGQGTLSNPFGAMDISKLLHDMTFDGPGVVWLAGAANHHEGDPPELADRGQRGAVRIDVNEDGVPRSFRRYVPRVNDDEPGDIVTGLPSGDVRAVLPVGDGTVYLVCGRERYTGLPWDHVEGPPFDTRDGERLGGVARVERDGRLTVLAAGDVVPDGRAGALGPDGTLYVLDAQHGLLVWDGDRFVAAELPTAVPAGSDPTALWVGRDGDLAASFTTGLSVRLAGAAAFITGHGAAWRAAERAPGVLLVGTDEGLLRIVASGATDVPEPPPPIGDLPVR